MKVDVCAFWPFVHSVHSVHIAMAQKYFAKKPLRNLKGVDLCRYRNPGPC